ncbi:MAG: proton-conducting transporter membrane subunit, partial [Bacteroidota bacterium]
MEILYKLIILLPLIGSAVIGLLGLLSKPFSRQEGLIGAIGTLSVAIPFVAVLLAFLNFDGTAIAIPLFTWMKAGQLSIEFNYSLDQLSLLMMLVVTGVGSLIHVYSIGYMKHDPGFYKYFAYLNLFIFAMTNLVMGSNMVVMFLGWEGVGLCSYLLIGFWYQDMLKANAAQKAFVANRIGDFAMLVAMFMIYRDLSVEGAEVTFSYKEILAHNFGENTSWIAFLIFVAATGKSAQIPLFVWLPDAMAGPTPVSALIHAATMVTAGIYLIARVHPIFEASPEVLTIIVIVAAWISAETGVGPAI